MKRFIFTLLLFSFFYTISYARTSTDSISNQKIENLNEDLQKTKKELIDKTINSYQQTNDRLNNYLTFTGIVATMFGVLIALGGIWIGFESLKSQKKRDEAIKILEEAKKYVEEKKSNFDSIIEEKLKEIENDYKKIIDLNKERLISDINNEALMLKELAERKTHEIETFSLQEKEEKAIEALQKRIVFFENIGIPDDPEILLSKAKLLREKKMPDEAIELLTKIIEIEPNNWDAYWELGWAFAKTDNDIKAIESYQKSTNLHDTSSAHNNIGVIYEKLEKLTDALDEYDKAIKLAPSNKLYLQNKAKILKKLNKIDSAIDVYKLIIELDKSDKADYGNLIKLFHEQKKYSDAIEIYDLAILNIPDKAVELNYSKAVYLKQNSMNNEAFVLFQNLISLNYKTEESLQFMAAIKIELKEKEEALKILSSLTELNVKSEFSYLKKAELLIEQDVDQAKNIIEEGLKHIDTYQYLLNSARIFAKKNEIAIAQKLQSDAIPILENEIIKHQSSDILNLYETLIILDKYELAKKIISENNQYITKPKDIMIAEFLSLCLKALENDEITWSSHLSHFKNLRLEFSEKTGWVFDDIRYSLASRLSSTKLEQINSIIHFLTDAILYEELEKLF